MLTNAVCVACSQHRDLAASKGQFSENPKIKRIGAKSRSQLDSQEFGEMLVDALSEDAFLEVLRGGVTFKQPLVDFATTFLSSVVSTDSAGADFQRLYGSIWLEPLANAIERIAKMCRCILHFFCVAPPGNNPVPTTDAECFYFSNYAGNHVWERSVKRVLREPGSWWQAELEDMIKKGAGSRLDGDKLKDLTALLNTDSMSMSDFKDGMQIFKLIRGTTRSQKMNEVSSILAAARLIVVKCRVASGFLGLQLKSKSAPVLSFTLKPD